MHDMCLQAGVQFFEGKPPPQKKFRAKGTRFGGMLKEARGLLILGGTNFGGY